MLPVLRTADVRRRRGSPVALKNTAERISVGTRASFGDVFVKVTTRSLPTTVKLTEAESVPELPENVTASAISGSVRNAAAATNALKCLALTMLLRS